MALIFRLESDHADGSTDIADSSGNGIAVTINGDVHHTTDYAKFGASSLYFDGVGDYLTLAQDSLSFMDGGDFTVRFWYKTTWTLSYARFFSSNHSLTEYRGLGIMAGSAGARMFFFPSPDGVSWSGTEVSDLFDGNWHLCEVSGEVSGDECILRGFYDGVKRSTRYISALYYNSLNIPAIGGVNGGKWAQTHIDRFEIYDEVLHTDDFVPDSDDFAPDSEGARRPKIFVF